VQRTQGEHLTSIDARPILIVEAEPRLWGNGIAEHLQHCNLFLVSRLFSHRLSGRRFPEIRARLLMRCAITQAAAGLLDTTRTVPAPQ
jgi:hypothetical protein